MSVANPTTSSWAPWGLGRLPTQSPVLTYTPGLKRYTVLTLFAFSADQGHSVLKTGSYPRGTCKCALWFCSTSRNDTYKCILTHLPVAACTHTEHADTLWCIEIGRAAISCQDTVSCSGKCLFLSVCTSLSKAKLAVAYLFCGYFQLSNWNVCAHSHSHSHTHTNTVLIMFNLIWMVRWGQHTSLVTSCCRYIYSQHLIWNQHHNIVRSCC